MTEEVLEKNPDELLADFVVAKLTEKGFISNDKAGEVANKLSAGTATSEDWTMWIDLALSKKQGGEKDVQS